MKSADSVGITFANLVVGAGFADGVVNVTLGAFQFTPNDDGKIETDPVIVDRLRMNELCAAALRDALTNVLAAMADARAKAAVDAHAAQDAANGADRTETIN